MKVVKIIALLIVLISVSTTINAQPSKVSISLGYGTHKIAVRGDFKITDNLVKKENSSTRLYCELGADWQKFDFDINFKSIPYKSNVYMIALGIGIGQEFIFKERVSIQPYLGLFYKYARFVDRDLVKNIGEYSLIRYYAGAQVGKPVENGYGNLFTIDLGSRIGFRITDKIELGGSIGICPAKFSTENSLFGKYWAQKPYPNDYYIKRLLLKGEANIKINF